MAEIVGVHAPKYPCANQYNQTIRKRDNLNYYNFKKNNTRHTTTTTRLQLIGNNPTTVS